MLHREAGYIRLSAGALGASRQLLAFEHRLGKYVTQKAVDVMDRQAKKAQKMRYVLVGRGKWHVSYKTNVIRCRR